MHPRICTVDNMQIYGIFPDLFFFASWSKSAWFRLWQWSTVFYVKIIYFTCLFIWNYGRLPSRQVIYPQKLVHEPLGLLQTYRQWSLLLIATLPFLYEFWRLMTCFYKNDVSPCFVYLWDEFMHNICWFCNHIFLIEVIAVPHFSGPWFQWISINNYEMKWLLWMMLKCL